MVVRDHLDKKLYANSRLKWRRSFISGAFSHTLKIAIRNAWMVCAISPKFKWFRKRGEGLMNFVTFDCVCLQKSFVSGLVACILGACVHSNGILQM